MKEFTLRVLVISALVLPGGFATASEQSSHVDQATLEQITMNWPKNPKAAIETMVHKYGFPNTATSEKVTWFNNGVWKRTVVNKEELEHLFPKKHTDFLEQTINYQVPPTKFTELAMYDGSVIVERTKGEMSARCDKEENNFLALNLAKNVIDGKLNVRSARTKYAENIMAALRGEMPVYMRGLQFSLPRGRTADPDVTIIKSNMEE